MTPYEIHYDSRDWDSFGGSYMTLLTATELDARRLFRTLYPNSVVITVEIDDQHVWRNNGRYSRYFTSKTL